MRLLMLNYEFPPVGGGCGHAHQRLLERFATVPGLEVEVITSAPTPGVHRERFGDRIVVTRVGVHKRNLQRWRRVEAIQWLARARRHSRAMLRSAHFTVVHAFSGFPTGWLCWRDPMARPYVLSLRGSDVPGTNPRFKLEYRLLAPLVLSRIWRGAAALVACSEGLRRRALAFAPHAGIRVIPNGVDLDVFHPVAGDAVRSPGRGAPLRLLTVGRLSATKRVRLLIEVVEHLREQGRPCHLAVVGGGPLEGALRGHVERRGLASWVTFSGSTPGDRMPELYRKADLYVSASLQEGMSNAMLEAAASGLPVVATRCEGVDELVVDNGVVVEEEDAIQLAGVIGELAADVPRRSAMAKAARRRAELFAWDAVAGQYLALYERLR